MANDANSTMGALKGLLGDNADEKIQAVMQSLSGAGNSSTSSGSDSSGSGGSSAPSASSAGNAFQGGGNDSLQYLMQMKGIIDQMGNTKNDPRANLLRSLRPYMRNSRQQSIDSAVRLLGLTNLKNLFR